MVKRSSLFKQIVFWIFLTAILFVNIYIIVYLNTKIVETGKFRDQMISGKYEGSLSENLGFLTMLTTEIYSHLDLKSAKEIEKRKKIENYLLKLKKQMETLEPSKISIRIDNNSNIEEEKDTSKLMSWLHPKSLSQVSYNNLNLKVSTSEGYSIRPYLESSNEDKTITLNSFVLIPSQLVSVEDSTVKLSNTVKIEVIFSKVIEKDLLKIFKSDYLKNEDIWQVYFIPLSGFVRIVNKEKENLVDYYKEILPGIVSFSDRPYFKQTLSEKVRISNPYIDSAGNGIIITHSVFILNEELKIIGMVGLDRKIQLLADFWKKVKSGFETIPKDFQFNIHPIVKMGKKCGDCHVGKNGGKLDYNDIKRNFKNEVLALAIADVMKNPNKMFKKEIILRKSFPEKRSTIYLVRTGAKEVACFHFNLENTLRKYRFLTALYILSFLGIFVLIVFTLRIFLSRAKTERIHTEVVSHLHGGLIIVDGKGNIKFHNRKMAELVEESGLHNKNFLSHFLTYESKAEYDDCIQRTREGFEFAGRIKRADETVFPAIITSASINYPGIPNAQMLLVLPSEQLESTIAANFIHSFSHALKTPISGILLLADRLRRKNVAPQKFNQYYSMMKQQVGEFTTMVTNLLRFSKLEIENIRPSKVTNNLAAILRSVIKPFKEKAAQASIDLKENIPESLVADIDRDMFRVILNNLLDNALKYTDEGEILVDAYEKKDEVIISIRDTGIGVPEDEGEKIFEKFFRGRDQRVRIKDGIGIGLYVSNKYVRLNGGILTYEPNIKHDINEKGKEIVINKGSKFILRVPKNERRKRPDEEKQNFTFGR